jgi:hypothetical protein
MTTRVPERTTGPPNPSTYDVQRSSASERVSFEMLNAFKKQSPNLEFSEYDLAKYLACACNDV